MSLHKRLVIVHLPLRVLLALTPLLVVGALLIGAARADVASAATVCDPYSPVPEGLACLFTGTEFLGILGTIQSDKLSVSSPSSQYVGNTVWIQNSDNGDPHWIEAGMFFGLLCTHSTGNIAKNPPCVAGDYYDATANDRLYWADDRVTCECYYAHVGDVASTGTGYSFQINQINNSTWSVFIGDSASSGYSNNNPMAPIEIRAGTEQHQSGSTTACDSQYNLEWQGANGQWNTGWYNSGGPATVAYDSPPYAQSMSSNDTWFRDWSHNSDGYQTAYNYCWG